MTSLISSPSGTARTARPPAARQRADSSSNRASSDARATLGNSETTRERRPSRIGQARELPRASHGSRVRLRALAIVSPIRLPPAANESHATSISPAPQSGSHTATRGRGSARCSIAPTSERGEPLVGPGNASSGTHIPMRRASTPHCTWMVMSPPRSTASRPRRRSMIGTPSRLTS